MIYKPRFESTELRILGYLNKRMILSETDKKQYLRLKKGFEGEVMFDEMTEKLTCDCLILNDLLLKVNNNLFQIDSLIITAETLIPHEVKNFEGDYYYELDRLYKRPRIEYSNPLNQLSRSESLLRQLLHNLGYNYTIEAWVVFINPEFTLYQAPLDKPIILPTQLNRYLKRLDGITSRLNGGHKKLADKLISLHIEVSPYNNLPQYSLEQLNKGITCVLCDSFTVFVRGNRCVCKDCGNEEPLASAVLRSVREFQLLFPDSKVTTNSIFEWCGLGGSKRRIARVLERNFNINGYGQWSYYE
ncbi:nuclease-related domain-containing protein [Bacillus sp. USDA818B3_A]|uniref:nuclease-related domain-containing protein n=1 Tax=Bacillus sp. USDA818B3_A TaxID=2698834 RepID=UPI001371789D|nr:nuclease-related domain-containing protein [Bacillus sp. USDA818B3_A]